MDFWEFSCMSLGAAFVVYYGLKLILFGRMLLPNFFFPLPKSFFSSMGEWAVVTGASEGIGRAYAFALAERGLNVVIISRTKEKLDKVAQKISDTTDQKVKVLVADFTKDNAINSIEDELKGMNIGVLVNNVAMLVSTLPEKFLASPNLDQMITKIINCNVKTMAKMCKVILPGMVDRGSGVIINISSGAAAIPFPLYTLYSASKIFVERVSQGLQVEYKDRGIIIQAVAPYSVSTQMNFYQPTSTFVLSPEDFVSSSLQYLRVGDRIYGSLIHTMMGWLLKTLPRGMLFSDSMQKNLQEYVRIQNQNGSHKTQALQ
ncbi:17-beta-hydroxysteroid dehydrogenase type 3 [Periophthalmus magnuspinnatus]|uniref:17-beta-hydroxysteroid dehydrogenase type 3 n=1 Tax=Periophthalmus magnuspinnatus TaxID=409849 RepID=UPI00145B83E8|nr:17-beta-hydroxysteroid dehydrogenase type 3 [Periophthalmus magnuspinnatus]